MFADDGGMSIAVKRMRSHSRAADSTTAHQRRTVTRRTQTNNGKSIEVGQKRSNLLRNDNVREDDSDDDSDDHDDSDVDDTKNDIHRDDNDHKNNHTSANTTNGNNPVDTPTDIFTLSTSALLSEVSVNYSMHKSLISYLQNLRQYINNISSFKYIFNHNNNNNSNNNQYFTLPTSLLSSSLLTKKEYTFIKPTSIDIIGSYLHQIQLKSLNPMIDIALTLPIEYTESNDHFDFLYFYSRAAYVYALQQSLSSLLVSSTSSTSSTSVTKKKTSLQIQSITIEYLHGCMYKPVLVIQPPSQISSIAIRLLPVWAANVFAGKKLNVLRNNIRNKARDSTSNDTTLHTNGDSTSSSDSISGEPVSAINGGQPTPYYNSLLAEDSHAAVTNHFQQLHEMYKHSPHLVTAMQLITVWARCRDLIQYQHKKQTAIKTEKHNQSSNVLGHVTSNVHHGHDRFTSFILSMLLLHLYRTQPTIALMRPELIIRTFFTFLSTIDLTHKHGLILGQSSSVVSASSTTTVSNNDDALHNFRCVQFPVIFIDVTIPMNLTAHISLSSYQQFQRFVIQTLQILTLEEHQMFSPLFLTPNTFESSYDMFMRIQLPTKQSSSSSALLSTYPMRTLDQTALYARVIHDLLSRTYTDRVAYINIQASPADLSILHIGIILSSPSNYTRLIDSGPSADDTISAKKFRLFWSKKSELRRFKDGRIIEAVIWPLQHDNIFVSSSSSSYGILEMTQYILQQHLQISADNIRFIATQLDKFMLIRNISSSSSDNNSYKHTTKKYLKSIDDIHETSVNNTSNLSFNLIVSDPQVSALKSLPLLQAAYTKFSTQLRGLDLPLQILSLTVIHEAMRLTSPFPPQPHVGLLNNNNNNNNKQLCNYTESLEYISILITFESSSRWPMDLIAMQRVKAAFYIHIQQTYIEKFKLNQNNNNKLLPSVAYTHVDFFVDGFAFRVTIYDERERQLYIDREKAVLESNTGMPQASSETHKAQNTSVPKKKQKKRAKTDGAESSSNAATKNSSELIAQYRNEYNEWTLTHILRPWLQAHIRAFALDAVFAHSYPLLCRIAKRWLASHMFLSHIPLEVIDLICMYILIQQHTLYKRGAQTLQINATATVNADTVSLPPASPLPQSIIACLYLFLTAITEFNWTDDIMIIDVTRSHGNDAQALTSSVSDEDAVVGGITTELNERMLAAFKKHRRNGTGAAMYIATELDPESTYLTQHHPTCDVLTKLVKYARSSRLYLSGLINDMGVRPLSHWMTLFKTPLDVYDMIITLKPHTLPRHHIALALQWEHVHQQQMSESSSDPSSANEQTKTVGFVAPFDAIVPTSNTSATTSCYVGFETHIRYLTELRRHFGSYARFSMDLYGGVIIAVEWRRDCPLVTPMPWQAKYSSYSMTTKSNTSTRDDTQTVMSCLNIPEIIADMQSLGDGIVHSIKLVSSSSPS